MDDLKTRLLEQLGDKPEKVASDLRDFSQTATALSDEQEALLAAHPLQWVCIYKGQVSANSGTLPALMEKLEQQGIPAGNAIVRFIEKSPTTLIL